MIIKPPDTQKDREAIRAILRQKMAEKPPEPTNTTPQAPEPPKIALKSASQTGPTTEETVAYQNREIGKDLKVLEKHYVQHMKIAGKPCDCGASKHLLGIEALCEETISMVEDPDVYSRLLDWVREVTPKTTQEASASGQFESEYLELARQSRDFRKEIMGTLDVKALWIRETKEPDGAMIVPVSSEEEKVEEALPVSGGGGVEP